MQRSLVSRIVRSFGKDYGEVIVGVASRIREVPTLIMGNFSNPENAQGIPGELDLLVPTADHRYKLLWQVKGIFRHLHDGGVLFCDGGVELELRLRVYTCEDLCVDLDWYKGWWDNSEPVHQSCDWLRLPCVDVKMACLLLRDEDDDQSTARLLLESGAFQSDSELPPRVFSLAAQLYADDLNRIADQLDELGEELE